MDNRLNEILNLINGFYIYSDDVVQKYVSLINESIEIIKNIDAPPTSMLENVKNETLYDLSNEITNRLTNSFFHAPVDRKKSEFKISKVIVVVAIGNVVASWLKPNDNLKVD